MPTVTRRQILTHALALPLCRLTPSVVSPSSPVVPAVPAHDAAASPDFVDYHGWIVTVADRDALRGTAQASVTVPRTASQG